MSGSMLDGWRAKQERQKKIDKIMCKSGYTFNETVQRCIPAYVGGGSGGSGEKSSQIPANNTEKAGIAIAKEGMSRKSTPKPAPHADFVQ